LTFIINNDIIKPNYYYGNKPILSGSDRFFQNLKLKKMAKTNFTPEQNELVKKFNSKKPIMGLKGIITHPACHLDEFGAIFILQNTDEGKKLFPGIENSCIGFQTETYLRNCEYMGFSGFIKALEQGYLIIGLGGGPFDEHSDRDKKVSCIELVKRYIDLYADKDSRSVYGQLINFINHEDNNGDNLIENLNRVNPDRKIEKEEGEMLLKMNLGMLAQNIKKGWEIAETLEQQNQLYEMVMRFFKHETDQRKLFLRASQEYKESSEKQIIDLPDGFAAVVIKSNNPLMVRAVRQQSMLPGGKKLGITVVYKSNGQFVIYPGNDFSNKMIEVAKILRQKISLKRNQKGLPFETLEHFGTIREVPELYIDENMKIIMNGSKTDPDVPGLLGTHLSLDDLIISLITGVDESIFDKKFAHNCKKDVCVKKIDSENRCSLFCFGLDRCVNVINNFTKPTRPFAELDRALSQKTA
jgi:hypothetical protein